MVWLDENCKDSIIVIFLSTYVLLLCISFTVIFIYSNNQAIFISSIIISSILTTPLMIGFLFYLILLIYDCYQEIND